MMCGTCHFYYPSILIESGLFLLYVTSASEVYLFLFHYSLISHNVSLDFSFSSQLLLFVLQAVNTDSGSTVSNCCSTLNARICCLCTQIFMPKQKHCLCKTNYLKVLKSHSEFSYLKVQA